MTVKRKTINQVFPSSLSGKRYKKDLADAATKLHIKEQLRKIAFPETTNLKPPSQSVKTKGEPKKKNSFKDARISKPPTTPAPSKIPFIDHMPGKGLPYCPTYPNQRVEGNRDLYTRVFGSKEEVEEIYNAPVPCVSGFTREDKWTRFPDMGHLTTSAYERICINLTRYGFSETFFPLRTAPTPNLNDHIICVGWVSNPRHFIKVYLIPGCHIPPISLKWTVHFTILSETWPYQFIERTQEYNKLNKIEIEKNREKSKGVPPLDLADDNFFSSFT
ncbi:uncharacterized protein LOC131635979 [Vicia villosa]|uniref:uncharacterized protein LOC131635979 n=1 Tax=Vicia villosa TaxID=3911 RepID=UPI00273AB8FC|nr:uncharacterized protein LOC131635979 [Vicia villosa]